MSRKDISAREKLRQDNAEPHQGEILSLCSPVGGFLSRNCSLSSQNFITQFLVLPFTCEVSV